MPNAKASASLQAVHKRTRNGCQTCKKRRKRCDEERPTCGACAKLNLKCVYRMNIRWGTTRESFETSLMPQTGLGSGPKDTLYELLQSIRVTERLHRLIDTTLDGEGRGILLKFLKSGYKQLANDIATNDAWLTTHFPMCEHSKACLLSLLAFQAAIEVEYDAVFDRYYDQALTQFTKEACSLKSIRPDSLFFAGLFMCTICLSRLMPYTNHLNAVIAMVMSWMDVHTPMACDTLEFLSVLGFLDLQSHTLNRMTPQNYIWYKYCRGQQGIHGTSGLPCSLMDLLSGAHIPGTEQSLLSWTVPAGTTAQQCLWTATRCAGILSTRSIQQAYEAISTDTFAPGFGTSRQVLFNNIIAMVQQCILFIPQESAQFKQTLIYPLVMAAAQGPKLPASSEDFIRLTIHDLASERNHFLYRGILQVIQEFWQSQDGTIEETARRRNVELCLL